MGPERGARGLCGDRSNLALLVPAIAGLLQRLRPDAHVHVLLESTGNMLPLHRRAMCAALGVPDEHAIRADTRNWSAFRRDRLLISTLEPPGPRRWRPLPRAAPWQPGWTPPPQSGDAMPTMMRSRPGPPELLLASTYQYQPASLLIATADEALGRCIHPGHGNTYNLRLAISNRMRQAEAGEAVLEAWQHLCLASAGNLRFPARGPVYDAACAPAVHWIARYGERHGFRTPSVAERSRALGLDQGGYASALGLSPRDLYDAQGNAFDRAIVGVRLGPSFQDVLATPDRPRHRYPTPTALCALYDDTAAAVRDQWPSSAGHLSACPLRATNTAGDSILDLLARPVADPHALPNGPDAPLG